MVAYPCDTFKNALQFALTSRHNILILVKFIILLWRVPKKNFEIGASWWAEGVLQESSDINTDSTEELREKCSQIIPLSIAVEKDTE